MSVFIYLWQLMDRVNVIHHYNFCQLYVCVHVYIPIQIHTYDHSFPCYVTTYVYNYLSLTRSPLSQHKLFYVCIPHKCPPSPPSNQWNGALYPCLTHAVSMYIHSLDIPVPTSNVCVCLILFLTHPFLSHSFSAYPKAIYRSIPGKRPLPGKRPPPRFWPSWRKRPCTG